METEKNKLTLMNDFFPANLVHPGEILEEELKSRGIRHKDFAASIGMQPTHFSAIISGSKNITKQTAEKISKGLPEIPAEVWMTLQQRFTLNMNRLRLNTSKLVSGYRPDTSFNAQSVLAEPSPVYGSFMQYSVKIPVQDKDIFKSLAERLGWEILS